METRTRVKIYFDSETRRIRRTALQISNLTRFELNTDKFTTGMLTLLNRLNRDNKVQNVLQLSNIRSLIKGMKNAFYDSEYQMDNITRYCQIKAVVGLRIKEQRLIINDVHKTRS